MAKTATKAVPQGDLNAPEGRKKQANESLEPRAPRVEAQSLRGTFAKSICTAHGLGTVRERAACDDGVPCTNLVECMGQADATLKYLELRKKLLKDD